MSSADVIRNFGFGGSRAIRSHSAQGLSNDQSVMSSPAMKIPLPPRLWITDVEDESSDATDASDNGAPIERARVRSRFRHYKQRSNFNVPIGIFWDIENCQVPRGCSAIDVVAAIRAKFLQGRREADFVVVCDVRKEAPTRLQELNDAQVSLIHVCGTQKNAADEKLRQCMRRFGELHTAPAALLLISGDINFAADLSDFRHRKNMEVILVHKQNTSSALIACASNHHCFNELLAHLPRNPKSLSQTEEDEVPTCEIEVTNLPVDQPSERVSRRLRRLADNCGGKVLRVNANTGILRFPTPDHASRALKRMDGEDVFGRKISTRYMHGALQPAYSSDEGYGTATAVVPPRPGFMQSSPPEQLPLSCGSMSAGLRPMSAASEWALALQQLPAQTPPPLAHCPPPAPRPRKIRGTHGSVSLDRSGSSSNSGDDRREANSRAVSPWNCSASLSEHSESDEAPAELTVSNLPPYDFNRLQAMLTRLFSECVAVIRVNVWAGSDGPLASVVVRSEWDARVAISRIHKCRLDSQWSGRRLELSLGRPSPVPNLDVLRARLRAILRDQPNHSMPLLRLRDAYSSRHCCALTTSDLAKVKDTVITHEGFGRMVQLVDLRPPTGAELEEAPWKCHLHAGPSTSHEDGSRILQPVYMEISTLSAQVKILLDSHGGILPLLSFVECYEAHFSALPLDPRRGVPLELLLRSVPSLVIRDLPSRHIVWQPEAARAASPPDHISESSRSSADRDRPRTAPALEPMLGLIERELIELLRNTPQCMVPFSKLIPSFHHFFGRQCRVADYGFTKLPDLLAALSNTIVVLGSGSSRVITLSPSAQSRRWSSDLVKLLRAQTGRVVSLHNITEMYQNTFGIAFSPVDYGVCTVQELMQRVPPNTVIVSADGTISLPRRTPTPDERARTLQFAIQAVEVLCHTPNLRMEFSRFVPAYHAHFGQQLRVAHYGCVKLIELFELIPDVVTVGCEHRGERSVRLALRPATAVMAERLKALAPIPLTKLSAAYAAMFGAAPQPSVLDATSLEALVLAAGGCVEAGVVKAPGQVPMWATQALAAAAVLIADRSVAKGSTQEYFESAFRRLIGADAQLAQLSAAGVIEVNDRRVQLMPAWRAVWRIASLLTEKSTATATEIFAEYTRRYEPSFCADTGVVGMAEFLRAYCSVFAEADGRWSLCPGVFVPRCSELRPHEDYSVLDTPPGQKGSRVFDSPKTSLWCSPPASALPVPTALLPLDTKRRTRLAAAFDSV